MGLRKVAAAPVNVTTMHGLPGLASPLGKVVWLSSTVVSSRELKAVNEAREWAGGAGGSGQWGMVERGGTGEFCTVRDEHRGEALRAGMRQRVWFIV